MKKLLSKLHTRSAKLMRKITGKKSLEEIHAERVALWNESGGDKTLRFDYPLTESSIVIDAGGFEGQWASDIFARYGCTIIIFEPVKLFAREIQERFKHNKNITCYAVGLSDKNAEMEIALLGNQTSLFKTASVIETVELVNASEFFIQNELTVIDLIKINIEGEEYNLLDNLIRSGFIHNIKNIQVQFHDFAPNAKERMSAIQRALSKTHHPTYQYEFVWENWERNTQ